MPVLLFCISDFSEQSRWENASVVFCSNISSDIHMLGVFKDMERQTDSEILYYQAFLFFFNHRWSFSLVGVSTQDLSVQEFDAETVPVYTVAVQITEFQEV